MVKRFLTATPKEILAMNRDELLESIRMSEGRIIAVGARVRGPNLVDHVSNAEVAAAFGGDIIIIGTYDVQNPYIPGLPSRESKLPEDEVLRQVQIELGRGQTPRELRELIGRPVGVLLIVAPKEMEEGVKRHYGGIFATKENARLAVEQGADIIYTSGWGEEESINAIRTVKEEVENEVIIASGRVHGPGLMGYRESIGKDLIKEEEIRKMVDAGADIISLPAPGTFPGWTVDHASKMVDIIHDAGALASLGYHTSQEGSDTETIRHIAILSKMAGPDMYELGDSGFTESMVPPENIMALSIAIRGRRHTYRRMAMSPLR